MMNGKKCTNCGEFKEFDEFSKRKASKDGLMSYCKKCDAEKKKAWYEANKERKAETNKAWYEANKERQAETAKAWREANKEREAEYYKAWYAANKERRAETNKAWYDANKDRHAETMKAWKKSNPGKVNAMNARRRAARIQRTPVWADKLVIDMIYEDCPEGYHVDHIIPLQGELVSGLHTEWNLQYLPASENISKGNSYEPE